MQLTLIVLYPLLVHCSVFFDLPILRALALISLALGLLFKGLKNRNVFLWVFITVFSLIIVFQAATNITLYLLYVPPVALPMLFAVVFINTLLPGREALITTIAEAARGPLSEEIKRYTKNVTIMWAVFCCLMVIEGIVLPFIGNAQIWSWMTSIVNYLMIAILFIAEYIFRKWYFPDHDHPGFFDYLKIVFDANVAKR